MQRRLTFIRACWFVNSDARARTCGDPVTDRYDGQHKRIIFARGQMHRHPHVRSVSVDKNCDRMCVMDYGCNITDSRRTYIRARAAGRANVKYVKIVQRSQQVRMKYNRGIKGKFGEKGRRARAQP